MRIFLRIKNDIGFKLTEEKEKPFSKLFEITKKYLYDTYVNKGSGYHYKDIVEDPISKDTIRRHIILFNKFNLLKKTSSGANEFRDDLYDQSIFHSTNYNAFAISALISTKYKIATEILKYIFKDSVTITRNQFIYKYDRFFNEKILCLADNEKYTKILNQRIYNRTHSSKLSMEYAINNVIYKLVILDMFIHEYSWFIIAYNIDNKKLEVYDQNDIKSFRNPKDNIQTEYIDLKNLDNVIINFIEDKAFSKEEIFYVKAPMGIINNLLSSGIIDDFEAYYENSNYKTRYKQNDDSPFTMSKYNPSSSNRRTIRKNLDQEIIYISKINENDYPSEELIDILNFPDNLVYYGFSNNTLENNYIFKISTTSLKKNFIIQNYKGQIEILNKSDIKIV